VTNFILHDIFRCILDRVELVEMEWDWLSGKHLIYIYTYVLHSKDVQHFLVGLFFLNNEPML